MSLFPKNQDNCPLALREVLKRWSEGTCSNAELIEASYSAMVDCLAEYRPLPLPTPPEEILQYRRLNRLERDEMSQESTERFQRRFHAFFDQENAVKHRNVAVKHMLNDLFAWATEKRCPASVLDRIRLALDVHRDLEGVEMASESEVEV